MADAYSNVVTGKLQFKSKAKHKIRKLKKASEEDVHISRSKHHESWERPSASTAISAKRTKKSKRHSDTSSSFDKRTGLDEFERKKLEKKKLRRTEHSESEDPDMDVPGLDKELLRKLTPSQRTFLKERMRREKEELQELSKLSHREKIDKLNEYLSRLPVHNDVPKVAAAGLG